MSGKVTPAQTDPSSNDYTLVGPPAQVLVLDPLAVRDMYTTW